MENRESKILDSSRTPSKPYVRWWWFYGTIREADIKYQLDWLKENNFGGVEIAWVYPLSRYEKGSEFLSDAWSSIVAYTKKYADSVSLGCDFTFGSMWPFGGSFVRKEHASRTFDGLSREKLDQSWEMLYKAHGYVINHLDKNALLEYSKIMGDALFESLKGSVSALFCDSWEIDCDRIWTSGFDEKFFERFGYSLNEFKKTGRLERNVDVRYDYRKLVAEYILDEFYKPFAEVCHNLGALSRVQCHGSLTDLLAAYSAADIPESESILFDPQFSRFASSAAALKGRKIVSAESFTCLYGFPNRYKRMEKIGDLKLLADSLFANGINHIIWHGMPYNPQGSDNEFFATVHVGPDCSFVDQIRDFNLYLEKVSRFMRKGKTYSDVAVYVPLEDN